MKKIVVSGLLYNVSVLQNLDSSSGSRNLDKFSGLWKLDTIIGSQNNGEVNGSEQLFNLSSS